MYEKIEQCPVCSEAQFTNHIICKDYTVSHESFVIVKCNICEFLFTNPRPDNEELGKFYESEDYISHTNKGNNFINLLYKVARTFTLRRKLKLLNKVKGTEGNQLLDYGCGTGIFGNYCSENGWEVDGVEPDDKARAIAEKQGLRSTQSSMDKLPGDKKYDIITMWHVLEHIPNLNKVIEQLKQKLAPNGTIVVAVPNPLSYDAIKYKKYWAGYDVPRHLYHFTQATMQKLMKAHKLKVKQILPMKLDAYYVSMLSEKYRKNEDKKYKGLVYLNAIIKGYKSNKYAKKNNNNYSSLIYIIRK